MKLLYIYTCADSKVKHSNTKVIQRVTKSTESFIKKNINKISVFIKLHDCLEDFWVISKF